MGFSRLLKKVNVPVFASAAKQSRRHFQRTQLFSLYSRPIPGLLRRFAPRNDGGKDFCSSLLEPKMTGSGSLP
jgi:hypothetical protein